MFGTPAPEETATAKKLQKKQLPDALKAKALELPPPKDHNTAPSSPSKQPTGIMKTPVTANKTRKSVSFGAHVVDNEGKREQGSKSGIPDDCPGKFPSPYTPGTELQTGLNSEQKPRTKLTAALLDARTTTQPKSGQKQKARDDSDITIDLGAPRSNSGKYWKEQYEKYAERSEKEVKKLVAKQQLAKSYAQKKDGEVTELVNKLEQERKRHRRREHELEQQNKEHQEHLRQAMADKLSASVEIAALKNRIASLDNSANNSSSGSQGHRVNIPIYEDKKKEALVSKSEIDLHPDVSYLSTKSHGRSIGKENSPPKPRHTRRQTLPDARPPTPFTGNAKVGVGAGQVSTLIGNSPRPRRASQSTHAVSALERKPHSSNTQAAEPTKQNAKAEANPLVVHSSPLPQASPGPDLWLMDNNESDFAQHDKMAIPISTGTSHSKPSGNRRQPPRHRLPKAAVEHAEPIIQPKRISPLNEQSEFPQGDVRSSMAFGTNQEARKTRHTIAPIDVTKSSSQHPVDSAPTAKETANSFQDKKEKARRRLAERKNRKQTLLA